MLFRTRVFALAFLAVLGTTSVCQSQSPDTAAPLSASTVPAERLIQPAELVKLLSSSTGGSPSQAPLILQVGSRVFFQEAHIPGSKYADAGSQPSGLQTLENAVSAVPKDKFIVLYCGCCPWNRCPNVGPAFQRLNSLGFTNVKVLYLANNFGDDWVRKGYPREH